MGTQYSKATNSNCPNLVGVSNSSDDIILDETLEKTCTDQVKGNLNIIKQIKDYEKEFTQIYHDMTDTLKLEKLAPCRDISLEIVSCFKESLEDKYANCGKLMDSYVQCINNAKNEILCENKPVTNKNSECECCKDNSCKNEEESY